MYFTDAATELLSVTVDGTEHTYEATVDTDGDGVNDTVHVDTEDGSYEYTDTNADGIADILTQFDTNDHAAGQAVFDAATGHWDPDHWAPGHGDPGHGDAITDPAAPLAEVVSVAASAEAPTIDSNGDGTPDTAVARTADGSTVLVTDTDADGSADVLTTISADGDFTTYEHADDHTWHATGHGNLTEGVPTTAAAGHAVIDPATGEWIQR